MGGCRARRQGSHGCCTSVSEGRLENQTHAFALPLHPHHHSTTGPARLRVLGRPHLRLVAPVLPAVAGGQGGGQGAGGGALRETGRCLFVFIRGVI